MLEKQSTKRSTIHAPRITQRRSKLFSSSILPAMLSSPDKVEGVVVVETAVGIVGVAEEADEVDVEVSVTALEAEEAVAATSATTEATTVAGQNNAPASTVARDAQSACPLR